MKHRFGIQIGDIVLMSFLLLVALFLFALPFFSGQGASAEIVVAETGAVKNVSLDTDGSYEITARGLRLTVQVAEGSVFVSHSDCRDGICRNTPPISRPGQSIVCAPAGVVVRISGEGAVVDGISG